MALDVQLIIAAFVAVVVVFYSGKTTIVVRKLNELATGKAGCAPAADLGNVTLHYFDLRERAEVIRLMLEETSTPYSEVRFNEDEWPKHKKNGIKSGLLTFGQVPAIETTSGVRMVQSHAIAHYIGRATGLECDCEDLHFCEVMSLGVEDVRIQLTRLIYDPEFTFDKRAIYLNQNLPIWLAHFEKIAPPLSKQNMAFFASERLTWVDFLVFDLLDAHKDFATYNFGPDIKPVDILATFPKLHSFFVYFAARPRILAFRQSPRRLPYQFQDIS